MTDRWRFADAELRRLAELGDPERELLRGEALAFIDQTLASLTPREERVLRLRFGLEGEAQTREQLAEMFGASPDRLFQIEQKARNKLRHPTRCQKLRYAAHAIGLAGGAFERWPTPQPGSKAWEAGVRPAPPRWLEVNGKQKPSLPEMIELALAPEPPPVPDAIEVHALTQGLPVERFEEALAPRATPPIGETENLARKLRLPRERLAAARLAIPPHDEVSFTQAVYT